MSERLTKTAFALRQLASQISSLTRCVECGMTSGFEGTGPAWLRVAVARMCIEVAELVPFGSMRHIPQRLLDLKSVDAVAESLESLFDMRALLGLAEAAVQEWNWVFTERSVLEIKGFQPPPKGSSSI